MLNKKISLKLIMVGIIPSVLFILVSFLYVFPSIKESIYKEKEVQTRELANVGLSIINHYYELEVENQLTRAEAQQAAMEAIKSVRFGENGKDYMWINDFHPNMIMHPFRPDLDGQDISNFEDPDGVKLFVEMVEVVKSEGSGYVPYKWQYYDDANRIEPKLSYVTQFEPWQWIIGTGVYVNDVDETVAREMTNILLFIIAVALISFIIMFLFNRATIIKPINKLKNELQGLASGGGDLTEEIHVQSKDEIGDLANATNQFIQNIREIVLKVFQSAESTATASRELSLGVNQVASSSNQIVEVVNEVSHRATSQSDHTKEILEMIEEITDKISAGNEQVEQTLSNASLSTEVAYEGRESVEKAIRHLETLKNSISESTESIQTLGDRSQEIEGIISTITEISNQTNLLALNAAIEAARAGENGRGFSVVADEVRKLAEDSNQAAQKISHLIHTILSDIENMIQKMESNQNNIHYQAELTQAGGNALDQLVKKVEETEFNAKEIEKVFKTIKENSDQVLESIQQISSHIEQTAVSVEEVQASIEEQTTTVEQIGANSDNLAVIAESLKNEVNKFKV